jgi:LysM repeat protein
VSAGQTLPLELPGRDSYVRHMKRISFFLVAVLLALPAVVRGQDAAVQERLNKLSGQIEDLVAGQEAQRKRIEGLAKELNALQQQQDKPNASYATPEDLKQLAAKLQEVDRKRQDDNEHILKELEKLGKTLGGASSKKATAPAVTSSGDAAAPTRPDKGYEYVIKAGDTYSVIAQAYREQGIKVTPEQIEKANPGVNPNRLKVGQKIFIPTPAQ